MVDLSQLNICFLAGTLGQGGAERQLYYLLQTLIGQGTNVELLSLTEGEFWETSIQELGVPVKWVGRSKSRIIRLVEIIASLRNNPPDIVQSQHFFANSYVAVAGALLRKPSVGAIRSNVAEEIRVYGKLVGQLSLRSPKFLAVNSEVAVETAKDFGITSERLHYVPNVVDCERFAPGTPSADGVVRLLAVGRLSAQKRMDRFLQLVSRLKTQTAVPFDARIVGDGPLRGQLEEMAAEMGLGADKVQFMGPVSDMVEVYQNAGMHVLTSDWEGTPNVILEAMACRLPVVATNVGGVPAIVTHGETGYLSDPANLDALAANLVQLMESPKLRNEIGCNARDYVLAKHSIATLTPYLERLYESVLDGRISQGQ